MPETETYIFGTPEVPTYEALQRRRSIAAALAAQKKGFPKTLGEGLTYLGESIGEAGLNWRLEQQERANAAANQRLLGGPGGSAPPVTARPAAVPAVPSTTTLSPTAPPLPGSVAPAVPSSSFDPNVPVGPYKDVPVTIDSGDAAPAPAPAPAPATVGEAPAEPEQPPIRLASAEAPTTLPARTNAVRNNITQAMLSPETAYPGARSDYVPPQRNAAAPLPAGERAARAPQGWTASNETWAALDDDQKAAAMALMEANTGKNQMGDAGNVLAAIHNRADKEKQTVGSHVSQRIYQPTIEPAQEQRLAGIISSPQFAALTALSKQYGSGEVERPHKATHFLAPEKTMLDLEAGNPSKYHAWRGWTGFDANSGQYKGVELRDSSHAFLSPDGAAPSMERGPPGTPVQIARVTRSREGEPQPAQVAAVVPRGAEQLEERTRGYADKVATAFPGVKFTSGYRSPEVNAEVGGARDSQHTHRKAIDMNLSGLSNEQKAQVIAHARANGATAIGNYGGDDIHVDFRDGPPKAWGPSKSYTSLGQTPAWFREQAQAHLAGEAPPQVAAPAAPAGPPVRMVNAVPAETSGYAQEQPSGPGSERLLSEVTGGRPDIRNRIATAALGRAGVVSDAPVPGMGGAAIGAADPGVEQSIRDRAAAALVGQQRPPVPAAPAAGPQVAGPVDPSMFSPQSIAGGAIQPAPQPSIQKAPAQPPSMEELPGRSTKTFPAYDRPVPDKPPADTPMSPEERYWRGVENHPQANAQTKAIAKQRAEDAEKARLRTDVRNQEGFRNERERYEEWQKTKRTWELGEDTRKQEETNRLLQAEKTQRELRILQPLEVRVKEAEANLKEAEQKRIPYETEKAQIAVDQAKATLAETQQRIKKGEQKEHTTIAGKLFERQADGSWKNATPDPELGDIQLTEKQGAALKNFERARQASHKHGDFWALAGLKDTAVGKVPIVGNYWTSPEYQTQQSEAEAWGAAVLRDDSGAVLGPQEIKDNIKRYFPQPGEERNPELIEIKRQRREVAERGMYEQTGPGKRLADKFVAEQKEQATSAQEAKAIKWIRDNPGDPRIPDIKKALGIP